MVYCFEIVHVTGADPGFSLGGGGAKGKRLCARTHNHERERGYGSSGSF